MTPPRSENAPHGETRTSADEPNFAREVDDFVGATSGVTHALILSADGIALVASTGMSDEESEQLAAVASGLLGLSEHGAALFNKGTCEQIIVRLESGYFLFMGMGSAAGLAVLTTADCDMHAVAYAMTRFVDGPGAALTPASRAGLRTIVGGYQPST